MADQPIENTGGLDAMKSSPSPENPKPLPQGSLNTTFFANGLRLITRVIPGIRSVGLGVWLVNGVRHQRAETNGYAHLLEHLLFRGAGELDALTLARRLDGWGGRINAQTGRELTALYGLVPGFHAVELLELFSSMVLAPRFTDDDVATERAIVLQEMLACNTPAEDGLMEQAIGRAWPRHPMGWPLLGDKRVIATANGESLRAYLAEVLHGNRLLVVACGAVDHGDLQTACRALGQLPRGEEPGVMKPAFYAQRFSAHWEGEQAYCGWLSPVPPPRAALYPAALVANQVLGGGMSSRLYQRLRDTLGLSYGISAGLEFYSDVGLWRIGIACEPALADRCRWAVEKTMRQLLHEGPTALELAEARQHLLANLYLEEDNPLRSMERVARETLYLGRNPGLADYQRWLESVSTDQVRELAGTAWRQVMRIEWMPVGGAGALKPPTPGFPSSPR